MIEVRGERSGRTRRGVTALVAVLALALGGVVATASPASALTCGSGDVCVIRYNQDGSTTVVASTSGNITSWVGVSYWGGYVWNHGTYWPGADHIQLAVTMSDGQNKVTCLHYGAVTYSGDPTAIYLPPFTTVTSATWRGECTNAQEGWHNA